MTIYYIDPVNGDDTAAGTSYAAAYKSSDPLSGNKAGDEVRILETPTNSAGVNGTYVKNQQYTTLSGAVTKNIFNAETAFSEDSGDVVTETDSTPVIYGTYSNKVTVSNSALTGKLCWHDLGSETDFSAYQGITFWFYSNTSGLTGKAAASFQIKLCSDTDGDTAVETFDFPVIANYGRWQPITVMKGSNLSATVRSVAIYINTTVAVTFNFNIDNIQACKTDNLSFTSVITDSAQNFFYTPGGISDDGLTLNFGSYSSSPTNRDRFAQANQTTALYVIEPHVSDENIAYYSASPDWNFEVYGSTSATCDISGGWTAASSMASQAALPMSFITGLAEKNCNFLQYYSARYTTFKNVGFCRFYYTGGASYYKDCEYDNVVYLAIQTAYFLGMNSLAKNCYITSASLYIQASAEDSFFYGASTTDFYFPGLEYDNVTFTALGNFGAGQYGWQDPVFNNCSFDSLSGSAGFSSSYPHFGTLRNCGVTSVSFTYVNGIYFHNYNQQADDHRIYSGDVTVLSEDGGDRHTGSGIAWGITFNAVFRHNPSLQNVPYKFKIASANVASGSAVTVTAWIKRSATTITAKLVAPKQYGVAAEVTTTASGGADTYAQETLTFTPNAAGVIDIYLYSWSTATSVTVFIDDLSIAQ